MSDEYKPLQFSEQPQQQPPMPMYDATIEKMNLAAGSGITGADYPTAVEHRPTVTENLLHRKASLEKELENVNAALAVAQKNQGAMELLDSIAKTGSWRS